MVQHPPDDDCTASLTTRINVIGGGLAPGTDGGVSAPAKTVILSGVAFRARS